MIRGGKKRNGEKTHIEHQKMDTRLNKRNNKIWFLSNKQKTLFHFVSSEKK